MTTLTRYNKINKSLEKKHQKEVLQYSSDNIILSLFFIQSKTVRMLAPALLPIFTRDELLSEFRRLLMFGFLEGLCLFSSVFETQMRRAGLTVAGKFHCDG